MRRRRSTSGFSLIELLIATGLSSIVLLGVIEIATSLVKTEVAGEHSGTVTAWSLISINAMNASISAAGAVTSPVAGANGSDILVVCGNWSNVDNAAEVAGQAVNVDVYCFDSTGGDSLANDLIHWSVSQPNFACPSFYVPPAAPPACTAGNYPGATVVATGVYRPAAAPPYVFVLDPTDPYNKTVNVTYDVGNPNAGTYNGGGKASLAMAQFTAYKTKILLEN